MSGNLLQAREHSGSYYVVHGEPLKDDYFPRLSDAQLAANTVRRVNIALLSTNLNDPGVSFHIN